jgi:glutamate carboxypeptidase
MHPFLRYATDKQGDIVALLRQLVECESPSNDAAAVARFTDLLVESTRDIASATQVSTPKFGPHVRLEFSLPGKKSGAQILMLGHSDTVWPLGTLARMPFKEEGGRLWGPGVLDMKAGLVFAIFAARMLRDLDVPLDRRLVLLCVSDEEVGSETSRTVTEAEARKSEAVLVLEPGTGLSGKLKTSRKGVGDYTVEVAGQASHAGVDFASGASAILELCRQVQVIAKFTNLESGITVNPGVIRGGTRTNVVAAEAEAEIDIRVKTMSDADALDRLFRELRPFDSRCELRVRGGLNRPPMERTDQVEQLFRKAEAVAKNLRLEIEESATGGGSDGNFTAALGIPTLDGLGAVGEGAHAPNESILVDRMADRVALLAGLIRELGAA